jgi:hypothetical protein
MQPARGRLGRGGVKQQVSWLCSAAQIPGDHRHDRLG